MGYQNYPHQKYSKSTRLVIDPVLYGMDLDLSCYIAPTKEVLVHGYLNSKSGIFLSTCGFVCHDKAYEEFNWIKHKGRFLL